METSDDSFLSWTYSGVNYSLAGNGGPECVEVVPLFQRAIETLMFAALGVFEITTALPRLGLQSSSTTVLPNRTGTNRTGRSLLIAFMSLTFGIELGFKFATRQMIWILNPCHITTMIQIYLLAAQPSRLVTAVYRLHMHVLFGATIALLLPVVNTRLLPFETSVYYIQHIIILVIPFYLMRLGGVYSVEALTDFNWLMLAHGILFIYHFVFLQALALLTQVNLNNMLCPAVSDPFYGRYYRLYAFVHQSLVIIIHGKVYTAAAQLILHKFCAPLPAAVQPDHDQSQTTGNGHLKNN